MFKRRKRPQRRAAARTRRVLFEVLGGRLVLSGSNPVIPGWEFDTTGDGSVTALDALLPINRLNREGGAVVLNWTRNEGDYLLDVNKDGLLTAQDPLLVIGDLNTNGARVLPRSVSTRVDAVFREIGSDVVQPGEQDVLLAEFEVRSADVDVFFKSLEVTDEFNPDDVTTNFDSFVLLVHAIGSSGGDELWTVAESDNGTFWIPKVDPGISVGFTPVTYEVRGKVSDDASGLSRILIVGLDVTSQPGWDPEVVFHSENSRTVTIASGNLYLTVDSTPIPQRLMLGGTLADPVLRINARAENEGVDITRLQISVMNGDASSIDRLELFRPGELTPFGFATIAGVGTNPKPPGYTTFQANLLNGQLVVPEDSEVDILVRPRIRTDVTGGVSGEGDQFFVSGNPVTVSARGMVSSNALLPNDGDAIAEGEIFIGTSVPGPNRNIEIAQMPVVVMSKITAIENVDPNVDGTAVPVGGANIGQFKFFAASNVNVQNGLNKVFVDTLTFVVNAGNVEIATAAIGVYNKADATSVNNDVRLRRTDGTVITGPTVTGTFLVIVSSLPATVVDSVIDPGSNITLALQANVTNPKIVSSQPSTLQASLVLTDGDFVWFDSDFGGSQGFSWVDLPYTRVNGTVYAS